MKIAIPVDENKKETTVCMSFGRCPFFMIYENETKEISFIDNREVANNVGGAGIKAAQNLVDAGVNIMLTPRAGENAADVLIAANIKVYKTVKDEDAITNINMYNEGKLTQMTEFHAGFHGHN